MKLILIKNIARRMIAIGKINSKARVLRSL